MGALNLDHPAKFFYSLFNCRRLGLRLLLFKLLCNNLAKFSQYVTNYMLKTSQN